MAFDFDRAMDGDQVRQRGLPTGEMTGQQAAQLAQETLDKLMDLRADLARGYALVPADNIDMEHEIGETLTAVRKAIKQARESLGKLSQQKLM